MNEGVPFFALKEHKVTVHSVHSNNTNPYVEICDEKQLPKEKNAKYNIIKEKKKFNY